MLAQVFSSDRKVTAVALVVALVLGAALLARAAPSKDCPSPSCFSPRQLITAREAYHMKREQGRGVLFVDVRGRAEAFYTGMPIGVDAQVPFMEPAAGFDWDVQAHEPQMEFRTDFTLNMDETLRAAHLKHDQPVILLCGTGDRGVLAALLLREHGYSQVYVVSDGFEGYLARGPGGSEDRVRGWKGSGLPWTARVEPRWLYAGRGDAQLSR